MTENERQHTTILRKLRRLKASLVLRLAAEGLAWLLVALVALVVVTFAFDYLLRLDQVELRAVIMAVAAAGVLYVAWRALLAPLAVPMDRNNLALLVERKYGQLGDRLISALQFAGRRDLVAAGMSQALIERVQVEADEMAQPLDFSTVVERKRMWRTVSAALVLVLLLGGFGLWRSDLMATWFQRNVLFSTSAFYPQDTYLVVEGDGDFHVHRGEDLTVLVRPRADSRVIPDRIVVHAEYARIGETRKEVPYNPDIDAYEVSFRGVSEEFEFYVTGGDDRLDRLDPHRVLLLETAELVDVSYAVVYPDYTNQDPRRRMIGIVPDVLPVPAAGTLEFKGVTTRPVKSARAYVNGWPAGEIVLRDTPGGTRVDGSVEIGTFNLAGVERVVGDAMAYPLGFGLAGRIESMVRAPVVALSSMGRGLAPELQLAISLTDSEDYTSTATELNIVVSRDTPPEFRKFDAREVSSAVTRQVQIPLYIDVVDGYGLEDVQIYAAIDQGEFEALGDPIPTAQAEARQMRLTHVIDLAGLKVEPGSMVRIQAVARDSMPRVYGGPNLTNSRVLSFSILSQDQLEEQMLQRIREAASLFSEAINNQKVATAKTVAARQTVDVENQVTEAARRRLIDSGEIQRTVGTEVQNFADKLRGIVDEMERNNSGSAQQRTQLREYVIQPLKGDIAEQIKTAHEALKQLPPEEDPRKVSNRAGEVAELQEKLVQELTAISENVVKFADRQQLAAELLKIIAETEKLKEEIENTNKIDKGGVFDD